MTNKFNFGIHGLSVCKNCVSIVTFALSITYTNWTLVDAQVKKDWQLDNQILSQVGAAVKIVELTLIKF